MSWYTETGAFAEEATAGLGFCEQHGQYVEHRGCRMCQAPVVAREPQEWMVRYRSEALGSHFTLGPFTRSTAEWLASQFMDGQVLAKEKA